MVAAMEMGLSESEFWNEDPIFFNEMYEEHQRKRAEEVRALYGG